MKSKHNNRREKIIENIGCAVLKKYKEDNHSEYTIHNDFADQNEYSAKKIFDFFELADPTQNKEYMQWIALQYIKGNFLPTESLRLRIFSALGKFHRFKKIVKFPCKDIYQLQLGDLEALVAKYDFKNKNQNKGTAKEVFNDENVRIIVPLDHAAACYYGRGTVWCTACMEGSDVFNSYNETGRLYILIPKKPLYNGEKYQLHFSSRQFKNESDKTQRLQELIEIRFPGLSLFFKEHEPKIHNYIAYVSDNVLQSIIEKIRTLSKSKIATIMDKLEKNLAKTFQQDAIEALQASVQQCRYISRELVFDEIWGEPTLNEMTEVMASIVFTELEGKDYGLSTWIRKNIIIDYDDILGQWRVMAI